jgi:hypothetical protein
VEFVDDFAFGVHFQEAAAGVVGDEEVAVGEEGHAGGPAHLDVHFGACQGADDFAGDY